MVLIFYRREELLLPLPWVGKLLVFFVYFYRLTIGCGGDPYFFPFGGCCGAVGGR